MDKNGASRTVIGIVIILILIAILLSVLVYILFFSKNYDEVYNKRIDSGTLRNPVSSLSLEEAVENFDETYIYFLAVSLKVYNLHSPPLSDDKPKLEIKVEDEIFSVIVDEGEIDVLWGGR